VGRSVRGALRLQSAKWEVGKSGHQDFNGKTHMSDVSRYIIKGLTHHLATKRVCSQTNYFGSFVIRTRTRIGHTVYIRFFGPETLLFPLLFLFCFFSPESDTVICCMAQPVTVFFCRKCLHHGVILLSEAASSSILRSTFGRLSSFPLPPCP
jgi:hypothetical protein